MRKLVTIMAFAAMSLGSVASAQTTSTSTAGIPNTGVGGDAMTTIAILGVSGLIALAAGAYALRAKAR